MKRGLIILIIISLFLISGINSCQKCIKEGELYGSVNLEAPVSCCKGLTLIPCDSVNDQGICRYNCLQYYCTKCSDGICKEPENKCNCPQDCGGAICGNNICEEGECSYQQSLTCASDNQTYCNCKICDDCK